MCIDVMTEDGYFVNVNSIVKVYVNNSCFSASVEKVRKTHIIVRCLLTYPGCIYQENEMIKIYANNITKVY